MADAADVLAGIARRPASPIRVVPNEQGYERARAAGAQELPCSPPRPRRSTSGTPTPASTILRRFSPCWTRARRWRAVAASVTVLGCPIRARYRSSMWTRCACAAAMGCYEISLGDTIGVGTPANARRCCRRCRRGSRCRAPSISTTPTGRRWPTSGLLEEGVAVVDAPSPAPAVARMPEAPVATWPARTGHMRMGSASAPHRSAPLAEVGRGLQACSARNGSKAGRALASHEHGPHRSCSR